MRRGERWTKRAVRDQLATTGWIRVEPRRVLGIFPRITMHASLVIQRLSRRAVGALRGPKADPRAAALVAGELRTVVTRAKAREYKRRIAELSERTGPAVPALRKVIQQMRAATSG